MTLELNFTYNEREHVMVQITEKMARQVAFMVYVPLVSFKDGEFYPPNYKCQARNLSAVGPLLVVTTRNGLVYCLFRTVESYTEIPLKLHFLEDDLVFFDNEKIRDCVQFLLRQPISALLEFEDALFHLSLEISTEKYRRNRLEQIDDYYHK
jgi:hypothetical protein